MKETILKLYLYPSKMKQFIFLLVVILFISCGNNSQQQSNSDIEIDKIQLNDDCFDEIKTGLIDSIRILKLNENEKSYFVSISKLIVHNDTLYVFDHFGRDLLINSSLKIQHIG